MCVSSFHFTSELEGSFCARSSSVQISPICAPVVVGVKQEVLVCVCVCFLWTSMLRLPSLAGNSAVDLRTVELHDIISLSVKIKALLPANIVCSLEMKLFS